MKYKHAQYAQALFEALQDTKPADYDTVIENFVAVLKSNGDLVEYEAIVAEYERYEKNQKGIKDVEFITASETKLNKSLLDELNGLVGKNVEVKQKVDENLIGGVVIKVDDTLIDGSIKQQLSKLQDTLTE